MSWSSWKEVDVAIKELCDKIKHDVEVRIDENFSIYIPLVYRTQNQPQGKNYKIKLYAGVNRCLTIVVWETLDGTRTLKDAKTEDLPE